jgi:hypothetical protein
MMLFIFLINEEPIGDVPAAGAAEDPIPIGGVGTFSV